MIFVIRIICNRRYHILHIRQDRGEAMGLTTMTPSNAPSFHNLHETSANIA